jgi:hypothetical protein
MNGSVDVILLLLEFGADSMAVDSYGKLAYDLCENPAGREALNSNL